MSNVQQLYLVSVPNAGKNPDSLFSALQNSVKDKSICRLHKFETPSLTVGTLDSLMSLSDDLIKLNTQVENVVRKVERQYNEIAGASPEALKINDMPIEKYLRNFQWDFARYRFQGRPLTDIVSQIQGVAGKVDEELKKLSVGFVEKGQTLAALQRKKSSNLAAAEWEDVLAPAEAAKIELIDSDTLKTLVVVVPLAMEKDFLNTYSTLGDTIASYGGPEWRDTSAIGKNDGKFGASLAEQRAATKGSPVAPESAVKIKSDTEFVLYSIVVLKGQYEAGSIDEDGAVAEGKFVDYIDPLKAAFRDKRFVVREFSYDASRSGGLDSSIEKGKMDLQQATTTLLRWCKAHFGELYTGWVHLKVIRAFVEAVLRYGLPPDFTTLIVEPSMRQEKIAFASVVAAINRQIPELTGGKVVDELDVDEDEVAGDAMEMLPFVCQSFTVIGTGAFK